MKQTEKQFVFILENFLYFGIVYGISKYFLVAGEGFLHLNLHPLLILTAIMSYRYGVHRGIISATTASAVYLVYYLQLNKDFVVLFHDFQYFKFILMFYIVAFIIGRIKDNKVEIENNLNKEISLFKKNYKTLRVNNRKLIFINNRMKDEIIKSEDSIISLYYTSKDLDSLEFEKVMTNVIKVFKKYIYAEAISIYLLDESKTKLELAVAVGENRKLPNTIIIDEYSEIRNSFADKKYGKRDPDNLGVPIFFAPILNDKEVIGMIKVERLNYKNYTKYTEKLFEILVDWINKSLSNAIRYTEKVTNEIYYKDTKIMLLEKFEERVKEEEERARLFEQPYFELQFKALTDDLTKFKLPRAIINRAGYDPEKKLIYVLCSATNIDEKGAFKSKILELNTGIIVEHYEA
jgi:hypothetical protein